jgi:glycosyltransferase involved in cell wall biosynthesis
VQVLWSPGYTAPLRAPCPQVVTLLDMQYKRYPEDLSVMARVTAELLVQQAARRCQRILTLSEFSKQEILRFTRAVPERIVVTPLAADPVFAERPPEEEDGTRLRRLLPSGAPYVLCVANTYPHKNVHALVEAFGQLPARFPQRLVLVGKPRRGEGAVRRALRALPAGRQVVRVAGLAAEDLAALYRRADLFLFPSLYEGFGLPVLEAMAAGTPVIAARAAAVPEVGGDAVCYFDGSAAELCTRIEHLLTLSDAERRAIAAAGQRQAAGFSWERTAARTVEVLQASLSA